MTAAEITEPPAVKRWLLLVDEAARLPPPEKDPYGFLKSAIANEFLVKHRKEFCEAVDEVRALGGDRDFLQAAIRSFAYNDSANGTTYLVEHALPTIPKKT